MGVSESGWAGRLKLMRFIKKATKPRAPSRENRAFVAFD
jgi:hypothetical protein